MCVIESRKVLGLYRNHSKTGIINLLLSDGNDLLNAVGKHSGELIKCVLKSVAAIEV